MTQRHDHKWTTKEFQKLIGMWLRDVPMEELCLTFNITSSGLNKAIQRLRQNGVPLPQRKRGHKPERYNKPWTQEEVETVVRMRNERRSTTDISNTLERSFYGVQSLIMKLRNEEDVPVVSLGSGMRRLWDAERLRSSIAGRSLMPTLLKKVEK